MGSQATFENASVQHLYRLIDLVRQGEILLPRFRRPLIWNEEQKLDLLDSVRRGLPIGSLLVWRTQEHPLACHTDIGGWQMMGARKQGPWTYLIDGHQRIITLLTALTPPEPEIYARLSPNARIPHPIYYDLQEESFRIRTGRREPPLTWIPLQSITSMKAVFRFCERLSAQGFEVEARRAEVLRASFLDYLVPVMHMVTEDMETVTLTFQRINAAGAPMSHLHMLQAMTAGKGPDLLEELRLAREAHFSSLIGFQAIDDESILATCNLLFGLSPGERRTQVIANALIGHFDEIGVAAAALAKAAQLLGENCGVTDLSSLPFQYQLVLAAMFFTDHKTRFMTATSVAKNRLVEWFWRTSFLEVFTGISPIRLRQVTAELRNMLGLTTPYEWPAWLSGEVEGPPSLRKGSSRLRTLRALVRAYGMPDTLLDDYQRRPEDPPPELIQLERRQVEAVGLRYVHIETSRKPNAASNRKPRPRSSPRGPATRGPATRGPAARGPAGGSR